jgi:hypothetical protein
MNNWLYFQNAGVGPMQGQASKYQFFFLSRHLESEGGNMLWWRRDTVEAGTIQRTRRPQLVFTKERTNQDATRPIRESPLRAKQAETLESPTSSPSLLHILRPKSEDDRPRGPFHRLWRSTKSGLYPVSPNPICSHLHTRSPTTTNHTERLYLMTTSRSLILSVQFELLRTASGPEPK